jgi:hypothetical protein
MMQRQRIDQRSETKLSRSLRDRRKKDAGRGRHAERREMMLGQVIGEKAGAIVGLDDAQPLLEIIAQRDIVAVEVVEDTEFHAGSVGPRWVRELSSIGIMPA